MSSEADRQLVESLAERAALGDRNKMQPMMAIVTEHGTGDFAGMVRVRRTPHEPPGSPERPFYYVFGDVPDVGAEVFAMSNFATGVVNGEATAGGGYDTIAEGGTPVAQQLQLNFGSGFDVADNAGATRTDVTFDPIEVITPIRDALLTVDGAGSGLDADLLDGVNGAGYVAAAHVGSGGAAHANATTSVAGFESAADKTKLDALSAQAVGTFLIRRSATQNNIANITETKINFDSEIVDVSGWYNTTTFRYVPLVAGYYTFVGGARILPGVAGATFRIYLRKNGTTVYGMGQGSGQSTFEIDTYGSSPPIIANGTTDFFELICWHDLGVGTSDIQNGIETYFGGHYIGTA
jgi:hypothetical protein